jgi:hypothetical protein
MNIMSRSDFINERTDNVKKQANVNSLVQGWNSCHGHTKKYRRAQKRKFNSDLRPAPLRRTDNATSSMKRHRREHQVTNGNGHQVEAHANARKDLHQDAEASMIAAARPCSS